MIRKAGAIVRTLVGILLAHGQGVRLELAPEFRGYTVQ
jgi:hypothetical protein